MQILDENDMPCEFHDIKVEVNVVGLRCSLSELIGKDDFERMSDKEFDNYIKKKLSEINFIRNVNVFVKEVN